MKEPRWSITGLFSVVVKVCLLVAIYAYAELLVFMRYHYNLKNETQLLSLHIQNISATDLQE